MQLPTEIRLQVLRKLLWQQETLRKDPFVLKCDDDNDDIDDDDGWTVSPFKKKQSFSFCPANLRVYR